MPNKAHKSKFATKGEIRRKSQGRVEKLKVTQRHGPKLMASGNRAGHKVRQLQSLKDKRQNKRQEVLHERRIGTAHGPPKVVAFFGLSSVVDPHKMRDRAIGLAQQQRAALDPHTQAKYGPQAPELGQQAATCIYPEFSKARLTLLSATNDLDRQLDAAKVADVAVLVIRAAHDDTISQCSTLGRRASSIIELDDEDLDMAGDDTRSQMSEFPDVNKYGMCVDQVGEKFLSILQAVGLPTVVIAVVGMTDIPSKRVQRQMLRLHTVYFRHFFPEYLRVIVCDSDRGLGVMLRHVCSTRMRKVHWRDQVPYAIVEKLEWQEGQGDEEPLLAVSGYLRGRPLSANNLVHISHIGSFQVQTISAPPDPCPTTAHDASAHAEVLQAADADAESLKWLKDVDPMSGEQTWPTEEDLGPAPGDGVPGGDDDDDDMDEAPGDDAVSTKSRKSIYSEVQTQIDSLMATDISRLEKMTPEQREAERKHFEEQRKAALGEAGEERLFPDEVDYPIHIPARQRFMRYRGLASFRSSRWDPYESLPADYARIFQFHNIKATQKAVWAAYDDMPVPLDTYIRIVLKGVPKEQFDAACNALRLGNGFLTLSGLRRHEHKWSLMHYSLQFSSKYTQPVKSKDSLLLHVGFRVMRCNPIFSEPSMKADKHKLMRYFHPDDKFAIASAYGPISYPPMPVLAFKTPELDALSADLVAFGSVLGADPNRIILKKVVLTGQPYKIHKKQAVVRFMFHDEHDIRWFQPVELFTKMGQAGRIKCPIGTHGYMKCQMSDTLRSEDTICMALYKRVYPKWTTLLCSWIQEIERQYQVRSLDDHGPQTEDLEDADMTPAESAVE